MSLSKRSARMRADAVEGVKLTLNVIEGDDAAAGNQFPSLAGRNVVDGGDAIAGHGLFGRNLESGRECFANKPDSGGRFLPLTADILGAGFPATVHPEILLGGASHDAFQRLRVGFR